MREGRGWRLDEVQLVRINEGDILPTAVAEMPPARHRSLAEIPFKAIVFRRVLSGSP